MFRLAPNLIRELPSTSMRNSPKGLLYGLDLKPSESTDYQDLVIAICIRFQSSARPIPTPINRSSSACTMGKQFPVYCNVNINKQYG